MRINWTLWPAMVLVTAGCSKPTTGDVSGTVTIDGKPADIAVIRFEPPAPGLPMSATVKDGQYAVTEVPIGEARVWISSRKVLKDPPPDAPPASAFGTETIPEKYNAKSQVKVMIEGKANVHNFDLTTK